MLFFFEVMLKEKLQVPTHRTDLPYEVCFYNIYIYINESYEYIIYRCKVSIYVEHKFSVVSIHSPVSLQQKLPFSNHPSPVAPWVH